MLVAEAHRVDDFFFVDGQNDRARLALKAVSASDS